MAQNGRAFTEMLIGLSLDGTQFNRSMKDVNADVKTAESAMRANLKILGNAEKSYDDLAKSMKHIEKAYKANEEKMSALQRAYTEAIEQYGDNSKEAKKYASQINNLAGTMAILDRQIKATNREMVYMEEGVEDVKKAMAKANKETEDMTKAYKAAGRQLEAVAEEQKGYARQLAQTEDLMKKQERVITRMTEEFGENSDEVKRARESYSNLGQELRTLEIRLDGATDKLNTMGYEGAEAQKDLQRQLVNTASEIRDVERAMEEMEQSSQAFQEAETRLNELRSTLGRTEQQAEQAQNALRDIGRQQIDTSEIDAVNDKLSETENIADTLRGTLVTAFGALTGGAVLKTLDEAISRMAKLNQGATDYQETLQSGVVGEGNTDIYQGLKLTRDAARQSQNDTAISRYTNDDLAQVAQELNFFAKQYGYEPDEVSRFTSALLAQGYSLTDVEKLLNKSGQGQIKDLEAIAETIITADFVDAQTIIDGVIAARATGVGYSDGTTADYFKELTNEFQLRTADESSKIFGDKYGAKIFNLVDKLNKGEISFADFGPQFTELVNQASGGDNQLATKMMNQFVTVGEELSDWGAQASLINNEYKDLVKGTISDDLEMSKQAHKEWNSFMGEVQSLLVGFSLGILPKLTQSLEGINKWIDDNREEINSFINETFGGFITSFKGIKETLEPVTDFIFSAIYSPISKIFTLLAGEENTLEGIGSTIGKVVGVLSALALINLPLKGIGMLAKLFGANGAISSFLASGVLGKAKSALGFANTATGSAIHATSKDRREYLKAQRIANSNGTNSSLAGSQMRDIATRNPRATGRTNTLTNITRGAIGSRVSDGKQKFNDWRSRQFGNGPLGIVPGNDQRTQERRQRVAAAGQRHRTAISNGASKVIGGAGKAVTGALGALGGPIGIVLMALPLIIPLIKKLYDNFEPFKNLVDGTWAILKSFWAWLKPMLEQAGLWIKEKFAQAWDSLAPKLQIALNGLKNFWAWLSPMLQNLFSTIKTVFSNIWNTTSVIFKQITSFIKTSFSSIWSFLKPILTTIFNFYKQYLIFMWNTAQTVFSNIAKFIKLIWSGIKNYLLPTLASIWAFLRDTFTNIFNKTKDTFTKVKDAFVTGYKFVRDKTLGFKNNLVSRFTEVKDGIVDKVSDIISNVKSMPSKIADGLRNAAGAMKNAATAMMNGMITGVETGINKVINGINTALGWFGVSKKIKSVSFGRLGGGASDSKGSVGRGGNIPMYHRGTRKGGHPGGPAVVNDAKGSTYREYIELPNGEGFIPKGRNLMLDLPKGTQVLDARNTKKYAGTGHIPHYKDGIWDWTKEKISGGINWAVEKIKSISDVRKKIMDYVSEKIGLNEDGLVNSMIKGLGNKLVEGAANTIFGGKKQLDASEASVHDGNYTGGTQTAGGKRINGVVGDLWNLVNNVIKSGRYPSARISSGLRPGARTAAGTLSDHALGKALDISGYGRNGSPKYAQIANELFQSPLVKYTIANDMWKWKNRFGLKKYPYGGHMNHVHVSAFARGGFVNTPTLAMAGEAGPEAIIPMANKVRGLSLLHDTAQAMGHKVVEYGRNEEEMAIMKEMLLIQQQQLSTLTAILTKDTDIHLDGRKLANSVEDYKRRDATRTNIARGI